VRTAFEHIKGKKCMAKGISLANQIGGGGTIFSASLQPSFLSNAVFHTDTPQRY